MPSPVLSLLRSAGFQAAAEILQSRAVKSTINAPTAFFSAFFTSVAVSQSVPTSTTVVPLTQHDNNFLKYPTRARLRLSKTSWKAHARLYGFHQRIIIKVLAHVPHL